MQRELFAGVMSGTSLDGIDGVIAEFGAAGHVSTLGAAHTAMPPALRRELLALQDSGADEVVRAARASRSLADLYASTIDAACGAAGVDRTQLVAAGVHGQTIRHRPDEGWTVQLNDPARVAESCAVTIVADFRRRDVAAGGQGAPLVPAFHQAVFGAPDRARAILNLGGIANLTLLVPGRDVRGFDTGPANVLLDAWHERHRGGAIDRDGAWAATGRASQALLAHFLEDVYFGQRAPKSTGRDRFNAGWLDARVARMNGISPADVQATLLALTARTVADALARESPDVREVYVCGGGANNGTLMRALSDALAPRRVAATSELGVAVEHVEALAFAWLARETLAGRPGNVAAVTGARGPRVLGAIYPS